MFFKKKIIKKEKKIKNITEKTFKKLSENQKVEVLMNIKNRGKLRPVLVHISHLPFEKFALSTSNLLELAEKYFTMNPQETLIKED